MVRCFETPLFSLLSGEGMEELLRSSVLVLEETDRARLVYVHLNIPVNIVIMAKLINARGLYSNAYDA